MPTIVFGDASRTGNGQLVTRQSPLDVFRNEQMFHVATDDLRRRKAEHLFGARTPPFNPPFAIHPEHRKVVRLFDRKSEAVVGGAFHGQRGWGLGLGIEAGAWDWGLKLGLGTGDWGYACALRLLENDRLKAAIVPNTPKAL